MDLLPPIFFRSFLNIGPLNGIHSNFTILWGFLSLLLFPMKMNQQLNILDDFKIYHENANKKFGLILNQALMLT